VTITLTVEAPVHKPTAKGSKPGFDEIVWQAWKSLELPEGYRAEIIEGAIEVSPTGSKRHSKVSYRLRKALQAYLDSAYVVDNDMNICHEYKTFIPDCYISREDDEDYMSDDGLSLDASAVELVAEVVSPGWDGTTRDRQRKRRAYARAGIPVYILIDDYDLHGTVTIMTSPSPTEAVYQAAIRVPYGKEAAIPEGAAKGFVITEAITGPARD
jgi:Uma2 family endonuclease